MDRHHSILKYVVVSLILILFIILWKYLRNREGLSESQLISKLENELPSNISSQLTTDSKEGLIDLIVKILIKLLSGQDLTAPPAPAPPAPAPATPAPAPPAPAPAPPAPAPPAPAPPAPAPPAPKPIDCQFGNWVSGECSATCGGGELTLTQSMISAKNGGKSCPTQAPTKTQSCNNHPCPIDCQLGKWSMGPCSKTCGVGTQTLTQAMTPAQYGGRACPASAPTRTQACNTQPCPVNCSWTWSNWSDCPTECGVEGTQTRTRTNIIRATGGGKICPSNIDEPETRQCPVKPCRKPATTNQSTTYQDYIKTLNNIAKNCGFFRTGPRQLNGKPHHLFLSLMVPPGPPNSITTFGQGISYQWILPQYPTNVAGVSYYWPAVEGITPDSEPIIQQPIVSSGLLSSLIKDSWIAYTYSGVFYGLETNPEKACIKAAGNSGECLINYTNATSKIGSGDSICELDIYQDGVVARPQTIYSGAKVELSIQASLEPGGLWLETGNQNAIQTIRTTNTSEEQVMKMQYNLPTKGDSGLSAFIIEYYFYEKSSLDNTNFPADPYWIFLDVRINNNTEPYSPPAQWSRIIGSNEDDEWAPAFPDDKYTGGICFDPITNEPVCPSTKFVPNGANVVVINPYYCSDTGALSYSTSPSARLFSGYTNEENGIYIPRNFMKKMAPYIAASNNWNIKAGTSFGLGLHNEGVLKLRDVTCVS